MSSQPWDLEWKNFLTEEETSSLLKHLTKEVDNTNDRQRLRAETDRVIVESLLYSGLKNSEFCRLTVGETVIARNEPVFVVNSTDPARTVYLPAALNQRIIHYCEHVRPQFLREGDKADDHSLPLILNQRGYGYDRTALYRRVVRVLTAAGFGDRASVQLLRHTYGYLAYKRTGGNLLFVQRQLGHAHPMVTAVYAQFVDESYQSFAEAVPVIEATKHKSLRTKRRS